MVDILGPTFINHAYCLGAMMAIICHHRPHYCNIAVSCWQIQHFQTNRSRRLSLINTTMNFSFDIYPIKIILSNSNYCKSSINLMDIFQSFPIRVFMWIIYNNFWIIFQINQTIINMPQLLTPHKNDWSLHSSAKKDLLLQVQYTTVVILDEMYLSRNLAPRLKVATLG